MVKQYIMVPFANKNEASNLGAKWDSKVKQWYIPDGTDKARVDELIQKYDYCFLAVEFKDKDHVKALGAMWYANDKKWYTLKSNPNFDKLKVYMEDNEKLEDLDNEDYDNPIPYISVSDVNHIQDEMNFKDYTKVNDLIRTRSEGCCQLCSKENLTLNDLFLCEVYEYIFEEETKKLTRLFAACKECRNLYKYGIKNNNTFYLKRISDMNDDEAIKHMTEMTEKKLEIDQIKWKLDLSLITDNGLKLK